jgi:hypothetical protein
MIAFTEKKRDALDRPSLDVVTPVLEQHMLDAVGIAHDIDVRAVNGCFVDIAVAIELLTQPDKQIPARRVRLLGA